MVRGQTGPNLGKLRRITTKNINRHPERAGIF
jgi:hypothetical protein